MNEATKMEPQAAVIDHQASDPMVVMIERVLFNPEADLDKLERMLAMKERMEAQVASRSYAAALSAARAEIPPIIKDATVDFSSAKGRTHYRHETLAGIAKTIDPILSRHGLSYRFRTDQGNGGVRVTCIVQHRDGHSEETSLSGAPDGSGSKNGFQAVGSAVTYLQRYTLKAALGLSAEVDDDAQSAAKRPDDAPKQQEVSPHDRTADIMITSLRKNGAKVVTANAAFRADFEALQQAAPDAARRVQDEIDRQKPKVDTSNVGGLADDEIPF